MKIEVVPSNRQKQKYMVRISQGVQHFTLDYHEKQELCEWLAKQFRTAVENHDLDVAALASSMKKEVVAAGHTCNGTYHTFAAALCPFCKTRY